MEGRTLGGVILDKEKINRDQRESGNEAKDHELQVPGAVRFVEVFGEHLNTESREKEADE